MASIAETILADAPRFPRGLLSREERMRCVERGTAGLYRWYVSRSQVTRNWNPDTSFTWSAVSRNHSRALRLLIEGFFAVEQYVPDYVLSALRILRRSYGRAHFHIRWGAEEEKHADVWGNALLALGMYTPASLDAYAGALRRRVWELPWDDPLRLLFYTLFQERATQVTYANVGRALAGDATVSLTTAEDPVLAGVCRTIAVDEAAHYFFFLEVARLFLYYFPEDSVTALVDVLRHFSMPARHIVPDYDRFGRALQEGGIFGRRIHYSDVVTVGLRELGTAGVTALEEGLRRSRMAPSPSGDMQPATFFDSVRHEYVEDCVQRLFARVGQFASAHGIAHIVDTTFVDTSGRTRP